MTQGSTGQRSEPLVSRLGKLARSDMPPEEFFSAFFNLVSLSMGAEAGALWFYNSQNQQLIPKVRAVAQAGPLKDTPDDVFSSVAYRAAQQKLPVLYYPEEGNAVPALKDIGLMSVPVEVDGDTSAIVLVARAAGEGRQYAPEDVHMLQSLCAYLTLYFARNQLKNAALMSTRLAKLAEIEADLAAATETEKMAFILANRSRELLFFDRVFVAFASGTSMRIAAVSGVDDVQQNTAAVACLRDLVRETARIGGDWHFTEDYLDKVEDGALRDKLALYFATTDYKSVLLTRLEDNQGLLGVLGCERRADGAYAQADLQFVKWYSMISARALRRAEDFRRLPGIALAKKAQALKLKALGPKRNRFFLKIACVVAVGAILVFGRWQMSVSGDCQIVPCLATVAAPRMDGVVKSILKTEGDPVKKGDVIALLDDRKIQSDIAATEAVIDESKLTIASMRLTDVTEMGIEKLKLQQHELQLQSLKIDEEYTKVISPQDGVIVSNRDELNAALDCVKQRGEGIARIADISRLMVEVEVAERDVEYVKPGQTIKFVLKGAPGNRLEAKVESVSPATRQTPGKNVFIARGAFDNSNMAFHPWLPGSGRIPVGRHSIGYVIFRSSVDWLYATIEMF